MVFHVEVDFSSFPIVAGLGQESGDQAQEGFFIGDDRTNLSGPLRVLVCGLGSRCLLVLSLSIPSVGRAEPDRSWAGVNLFL